MDTVGAMTLSPDGNWLFTVNVSGLTMNEYQVNTTTGALTLDSTISLLGTATGCALSGAVVSQNCTVAVSPSEQYVMVSLGTSGDAVFSYTSGSGVTTLTNAISSGYSLTNSTGDFSVVRDANNYAYSAQTRSVSVYGIGSTIASEGTIQSSGLVPRGITLNKTYNNVFTANEGSGTISSYAISGSGGLNQLASSPFAGPPNVSALAVDNTGAYMVAVGYDANTGVRLYSLSSTGALTQVAQAPSGTSTLLPALVAMTH